MVISNVIKFHNIWLRQTKDREQKPTLGRTEGRTRVNLNAPLRHCGGIKMCKYNN